MKQTFVINSKRAITAGELQGCLEDTISENTLKSIEKLSPKAETTEIVHNKKKYIFEWQEATDLLKDTDTIFITQPGNDDEVEMLEAYEFVEDGWRLDENQEFLIYAIKNKEWEKALKQLSKIAGHEDIHSFIVANKL
jgi:hypothetical protein